MALGRSLATLGSIFVALALFSVAYAQEEREASFHEDVWQTTEPDEPSSALMWDETGFERVDQYVSVSPEELARPFEELVEPLFSTPSTYESDWNDWNDWTQWEQPEAEKTWEHLFVTPIPEAWSEPRESDDIPQDMIIADKESSMNEPENRGYFEFDRQDDLLWAEQVAWEERQERERAYLDALYEKERIRDETAWQRRGVEELTEEDVKTLQAQALKDRIDLAGGEPEPMNFPEQVGTVLKQFVELGKPRAQATFVPVRTSATEPDVEVVGWDTWNRVDQIAPEPEWKETRPGVQWGFNISDEERLRASNGPPSAPKGETPTQNTDRRYGWFFQEAVPYYAKEWSNKTLEFFGLRK